MTRYLSGLCVAGLGLCGGGWLVMAAVAFGGKTRGTPGRVNLLTGAGLVIVSAAALCCWAVAWRQRMRADGVLGGRSAPAPAPQPAERPAPQPPEHPASHSAELAGELRSLLGPLLSAVAAVEAVEGFGPPPANGSGHAAAANGSGHAAANGGGHAAAANGNGHAAANGPAHAGQPVTAAFPSDGEESW